MTVVIDTLKSVLRRGLTSNVLQKFFKGIETKFNSPTAIIGKLFSIGVITSSFRSTIRSVFRGKLSVTGLAVGWVSLFKTTTRSGMPRPQMALVGFDNNAAFTFTKPITSAREAKNGQSAVGASSTVDKIVNGWKRSKFNGIFIVGHLIKANFFNYLARAVESSRFLQPVFIVTQGVN